MNKTDLVRSVAEAANLSKSQADAAVKCVFESIADSLEKEDAVAIAGFGTFSTSQRAARKGRNPRDGSAVDIPASTVVRFKAGKNLKEAVN